MKKYLTVENICFVLLLLINAIFASWYLFQGTITFHTDIARDFLLLEDIAYNKNITLIGPRSGGIPGVFHGPLWIYLNLPAFIIGGGDPVIVGWFWVLLYLLSIAIVYWVGKKLWNKEVGMLAALLVSVTTVTDIHSLFNPYGAVILYPLFLYFIIRYIQDKHILQLLLGLFTLGVIIQFQMAFGGPLLILMILYLIYDAFKVKSVKPLLALAILIIPLSSFVMFELRNDFLQMRSVYNYVSGAENAGKLNESFSALVHSRGRFMLEDVPGLISDNKDILSYAVVAVVLFALYKQKKNPALLIFLYFYIGYWVLAFFYKGVIWGYYYWPFLAGVAVIFAAALQQIPVKVRYALFFIIYMVNMLPLLETPWIKLSARDSSLWGFYKNTAETIYNEAPAEFGYFIYTNDQYGYSTRYGMNYLSRHRTDKTSYPFQKKPTTYLLIDDTGDHPFTNKRDWRKYDVKIDKKPIDVDRYAKTYYVETFELSEEELTIAPNPNLIQTLIFR